MNILVIGCGELGGRLSDMLFRCGHNVSVIDENAESFKVLSDSFDGITVMGMPMDMETLKKGGIEDCDAVAVTTDDDNLNITVSQIAKEFFDIKNVVTKIVDPAREKIFNGFGLQTMCETKLSTEAMFSALTEKSSTRQITFGSGTLSVIVKEAESFLIGRSLSEIPQKHGELIIGVINKNNAIILNTSKGDVTINSMDKILCVRVIE
jgi:trk system potassium uptake protein TrkA